MADDLKTEIEALRSQIEALTKQIPRTAEAASGGSPGGQTDLLGGAALGQFGIDADTVDKIKDQFDGFVDVLEKHLQEIPAGTALAIFALGVLLGRLLPR
jgi:hypothetical protein